MSNLHTSSCTYAIEPTIQSKGVDIFTVIAARHVFLAKANGILAFGDTVKDFKVCFRDTLATQM
jgi:hypothetical protein